MQTRRETWFIMGSEEEGEDEGMGRAGWVGGQKRRERRKREGEVNAW